MNRATVTAVATTDPLSGAPVVDISIAGPVNLAGLGSFETGVEGWTGAADVAVSQLATSSAMDGADVLELTYATGAYQVASSAFIPCEPLTEYTALVSVRAAATARAMSVSVQQWTAGFASLGYFGGGIAQFTDSTSSWTTGSITGTTLSTAAWLQLYVTPFPSAAPGGEQHWLDEYGVFLGTSDWVPGNQVTATVLRSDGQYVLGASPLNPLVLSSAGTANIVDRAAPYGVPVTYVVNLSCVPNGGSPITAPPSVPTAPVIMGQAPDTLTLYGRMGWAQTQDTSGELLDWLSGLGEMAQSLDSIATDGYDTNGNVAPGWSQVLDIDRCPTDWLPWLGQFVGARLDPMKRDDVQRSTIEHPAGWARGTRGAILAAANRYLANGYTATLDERDTSPYHLTITIPTVGYVGSTTCLALSQEFATCADLIGAFATCLTMWSEIPSGGISGASTCAELITLYATCAVLAASVATCADLWATDFLISQSITAVVPAGINTTIVYA